MKALYKFILAASAAALSAGCAVLPGSGRSSYRLPSDSELPIMAWYSIPAEDASLERYQELHDCGFNVNFSHLYRLEDAKKALDLGEKTGVKIMFMCNELSKDPEGTVRQVKDHPALYGYFLKDEPVCSGFPELAAWADKIRRADSSHLLYLNLLPSYVDSAALGCSYREYVRRFIEEVKLPLVSFDNYPVTTDGVRQTWYENLEIVADESSKAGLPFWAFALSTSHASYPLPTLASLRLQMYTNLAYGAQGLQYFTYWNPGTETWNFHDAPINLEKKRTAVYDLVKTVNAELQARAGVFVGSKVLSVCQTGETIPPHTKRLAALPHQVSALTTEGPGAVVSVLEKGNDNFLVIVSRSLDENVSVKLGFRSKAWQIDRKGEAVSAPKSITSYAVGPGDALIFRFRK